VWGNLRGEVDLDDVIVLCALRDMNDRAVFDFIEENIDIARLDPGTGPIKDKDVSEPWKALLARTPNSDAVQGLVDVLAVKQLSSGRSVLGASGAVQGAHQIGATDYFRRILQEQLSPGELRDQEVLGDIERWKQDRGGPMFLRLFNTTDDAPRYVNVWEYFAWRIEDEDLFDLAGGLIDETLRADGREANMKSRPVLLATWRRLNRRGQRPESVAWLQAQITLALPVSLRFADDLLYYWAGNHGIVSGEGRAVVRRSMLNTARAAFPDAAALLRTVVDTEENRQGYALVHFVRPPNAREHIDIEPRGREWLAPLLLEAARLQPYLVIPNLIHMVGDHDVWAGLPETDPRTLLERVYKLHRDQVETICGEYAVSFLN
jgi:hypothetical protein